MKALQKFLGMILIIIVSVLIASAFGAIHNQFSFLVSNEFFKQYLFGNFGVNEWNIESAKTKASIVGILGSYWVGFYLGILYAIIYLFLKTNRNLKNVLIAILINIGIAFLGSFIGFLIGHFVSAENAGVFIDFGTERPQNYIEAAYMHTASYYGGFLGIIFGIIYLVKKNKNIKNVV
jgi:hypothetical protein